MICYRFAVILMLALAPTTAKPEDLFVPTLTLHDAALCASHHPQVAANQALKRVAKATQRQEIAGYLPNISVHANAKRVRVNGTDQSWSGNFAINGSQHIVSASGPIQRARRAGFLKRQADQSTKHVEQQLRLAIEETFLHAWLCQQKLSLVSLLYHKDKASLTKDLTAHYADLMSRPEALEAETTFQATELAVRQYQQECRDLIIRLEELTGLRLQSKRAICRLVWRPHAKPDFFSKDQYLQAALENRHDLKAKRQETEGFLYERGLSSGRYLPQVDAIASYEQHHSSYQKDDPYFRNENYFAGVRASWNIFDGGANRAAADKSSAQAAKAQSEYDLLIRSIRREIEQLCNKLVVLEKELIAKRVGTQSAQASFGQVIQRYHAGLASHDQFLQAHHRLYERYFSFLQTHTTLFLLERKLLAATGYGSI
jgi:outer membrane protein TolC